MNVNELTAEQRDAINLLHYEKCSCVISKDGMVTICREHGISDLYRLFRQQPAVLYGAFIADKVIGKGAAALMILGNAKTVYADVISRPALGLLESASVETTYSECVPAIINRAGIGFCPVETLCAECDSAEDCLPMIEQFVNNLHHTNHN